MIFCCISFVLLRHIPTAKTLSREAVKMYIPPSNIKAYIFPYPSNIKYSNVKNAYQFDKKILKCAFHGTSVSSLINLLTLFSSVQFFYSLSPFSIGVFIISFFDKESFMLRTLVHFHKSSIIFLPVCHLNLCLW